jgi:protein subunit release factor A
MKNFITIVALCLLVSCTEGISQQVSEEAKKDAEYEELIRQARETREINKVTLQRANERTSEIITKTTEKIISLKEEVLELKEEINEIINQSDTVDLNIKFKLLPIAVSDSQENRK